MRMVKKMVLGRIAFRGEGWSLVVEVLLLFKKTKVNQKWQKRRKSFSWCVHTHTHTSVSAYIFHTCDLCFSTGPICSQQMVMTKTLLTEVLLEVTNEEIFLVAKETHHKATKGLLLFPSVRATVPNCVNYEERDTFPQKLDLVMFWLMNMKPFCLTCIMVILYDKQKCNSSSAILC